MSNLFKRWSSISLVLRIVAGLTIGTLLGLAVPNFTAISLLGDLFVGALKAIAPILVFFLVMSAISHHKSDKETNMGKIIGLYILSTFIAALVAVVASFLFPTEIILGKVSSTQTAPEGISEVIRTLLLNVVQNPVEALYNGNYIGILAFSVLLGLSLKNAKETTKDFLQDTSEAISDVVRWVIQLAPFGIMGLIFKTISENGLETFSSYRNILFLLVGSMLFVALVTNPLIVYLNTGKNPYPLVFKCLKDSGITAFFTRSSAANIPVNMKLCEDLGLDKDTYSVSIPLGATINMAGAAITINTLTLAAAYTLGIEVDFLTALLLSVVSSVSACGASGVAGGSLLLIPLACSLFGISGDIAYQVVAVGLIVGVIQDSCETALNSSTDALLTATAEYAKKRKNNEEFELVKETK